MLPDIIAAHPDIVFHRIGLGHLQVLLQPVQVGFGSLGPSEHAQAARREYGVACPRLEKGWTQRPHLVGLRHPRCIEIELRSKLAGDLHRTAHAAQRRRNSEAQAVKCPHLLAH
eukprot:COSAG01_NODE_735_length_13969_cov_357.018241_12_plen_114_part_00